MSDTNQPSHADDESEPANEAPASPEQPKASLLDLFLIVSRNQQLVTRTILYCAFLGVLVALFSSARYTSSATVIREVETDGAMGNMGGLALLRGIGVNLGGASSGLTSDAYPDIINSREVRLAVVRDTFYFREIDQKSSLTDFANRTTLKGLIKRFTIGLPGTILEAFSSDERANGASGMLFPTTEEERAMKWVANQVETQIDQETGLMFISSTTHDPFLSFNLTESIVNRLVERVEIIRTEKAKRDLQFITDRFSFALDSLQVAENELALFEDSNNNPQGARLRTQRDRLQRQVTFKTELFSDLQAQRTQAEIDLQRSRPVITLLEKPVPPIEPSSPQRLLIIVMSLIIGLVLGVILAYAKSMITGLQKHTDGTDNFSEIMNVFSSTPILHRVTSRFTPKSEN